MSGMRFWNLFNASKCKVVHFGYNNPKFPYEIQGQVLENSSQERDLGVIVQPNIDFDKQIGIVTEKANKILAMIKRSYDNKQMNNIKKLYKSVVWIMQFKLLEPIRICSAESNKNDRRIT